MNTKKYIDYAKDIFELTGWCIRATVEIAKLPRYCSKRQSTRDLEFLRSEEEGLPSKLD